MEAAAARRDIPAGRWSMGVVATRRGNVEVIWRIACLRMDGKFRPVLAFIPFSHYAFSTNSAHSKLPPSQPEYGACLARDAIPADTYRLRMESEQAVLGIQRDNGAEMLVNRYQGTR